MNQINQMPEIGFLRIEQILGCKKKGIAPILPLGRTTWWQGIKDGKYPKPIKIGSRAVAWRVEDVRALLENLGGGK